MSIATAPVVVTAIVPANPAVFLKFDNPGVIDQPINSERLETVLALAPEGKPFCFCHLRFIPPGCGWHRQHNHPGIPQTVLSQNSVPPHIKHLSGFFGVIVLLV